MQHVLEKKKERKLRKKGKIQEVGSLCLQANAYHGCATASDPGKKMNAISDKHADQQTYSAAASLSLDDTNRARLEDAAREEEGGNNAHETKF